MCSVRILVIGRCAFRVRLQDLVRRAQRNLHALATHANFVVLTIPTEVSEAPSVPLLSFADGLIGAGSVAETVFGWLGPVRAPEPLVFRTLRAQCPLRALACSYFSGRRYRRNRFRILAVQSLLRQCIRVCCQYVHILMYLRPFRYF